MSHASTERPLQMRKQALLQINVKTFAGLKGDIRLQVLIDKSSYLSLRGQLASLLPKCNMYLQLSTPVVDSGLRRGTDLDKTL